MAIKKHLMKPVKVLTEHNGGRFLPPLYARGENGNILMTEYEVKGNSFRSITGLKDSPNRLASGWVECRATNEGRANARTAEEQASFEAQARWQKKQDQEGYHIKESDIDNGAGFVEPMLAYPMAGRKLPKRIMLDRKYNGMRMIATGGKGYSRKGKEILTAPHILEALGLLFKKYPNLVADGECYNHSMRFNLNDMLSIVKRKNLTKEDLAKSEDIVRYYVYDGYGFDNITEATPCIERREALKKLLKGIKYVEVVEYFVCKDEAEMMKRYTDFVSDGYEGAIIRNADAPYQHKRTNDLLKIKPEEDAEGMIMGLYEGNGAWRDCAKTATIRWNKITFDATFKCSQDVAKKILKNQNTWVGKTVTFKYNGLTGKGVPNFAQIDPNNCNIAH